MITELIWSGPLVEHWIAVAVTTNPHRVMRLTMRRRRPLRADTLPLSKDQRNRGSGPVNRHGAGRIVTP